MTDEHKIEHAACDEKLKKRLALFSDRTKETWPSFSDIYSMAWNDSLDWRDANPKPLPEDLAKHREELRLMEARTMKLVSDIEAEMQKAGPVTGPIYYGEIAKLLIDWHAERRTFRGDATGEGEK